MPVLWEYHDIQKNSHVVNHTVQASQALAPKQRVQVSGRPVDCEVDDLPYQDGRLLSEDEQMLGR
jgi:hypothetical protein